MNSFTFVFRSKEARVVATILLFLLALEVFFRATGSRLSRDVRNIERIVDSSMKLGQTAPPRALFVGNSILNAGIDPTQFKEEVVAQGGDPNLTVSLNFPDSSQAATWDYLLRKYYMHPGRLPEDVIIVTGRIHLLDAPHDPVDMGAYFVASEDIGEYLRHDAGGYDNACAFMLGQVSAMARSRKRVSPRIYDVVLPHYQENWLILNRAQTQDQILAGADEKAEGAPPTVTRHLRAIAEMLRNEGVRLTVVLAPSPTPYALDPRAAEALGDEGVSVIDLSQISGLGPEGFSDPDHVNAAGKVLFTKALAQALAVHWSR